MATTTHQALPPCFQQLAEENIVKKPLRQEICRFWLAIDTSWSTHWCKQNGYPYTSFDGIDCQIPLQYQRIKIMRALTLAFVSASQAFTWNDKCSPVSTPIRILPEVNPEGGTKPTLIYNLLDKHCTVGGIIICTDGGVSKSEKRQLSVCSRRYLTKNPVPVIAILALDADDDVHVSRIPVGVFSDVFDAAPEALICVARLMHPHKSCIKHNLLLRVLKAKGPCFGSFFGDKVRDLTPTDGRTPILKQFPEFHVDTLLDLEVTTGYKKKKLPKTLTTIICLPRHLLDLNAFLDLKEPLTAIRHLVTTGVDVTFIPCLVRAAHSYGLLTRFVCFILEAEKKLTMMDTQSPTAHLIKRMKVVSIFLLRKRGKCMTAADLGSSY